MKIKTLKALPLVIASSLPFTAPQADTLAIVVNPSLQNSLSAEQIRRIYMGKLSQLPDGSLATPLIVQQSDQMHARFSRSILKRSSKQMKSYWAKRLFTGKSNPPKTVRDLQEMKELIATNKGFIGYMLLSDTDDSVKTVFVAANS